MVLVLKWSGLLEGYSLEIGYVRVGPLVADFGGTFRRSCFGILAKDSDEATRIEKKSNFCDGDVSRKRERNNMQAVRAKTYRQFSGVTSDSAVPGTVSSALWALTMLRGALSFPSNYHLASASESPPNFEV